MLGFCRLSPPSIQAVCFLLAGLLLLVPVVGHSQTFNHTDDSSAPDERLDGTWRLVEAESNPVDPWNSLAIKLDAGPSRLSLTRRWHGPTNYTAVDSVRIPIDGAHHRVSLPEWPDNRHLGAVVDPDRSRRVAAQWLDDGRTLRVTSRFWVEASQGSRRIRTYTEYHHAPDGNRIVVLELRSTRPTARRYVLKRASEHGPEP